MSKWNKVTYTAILFILLASHALAAPAWQKRIKKAQYYFENKKPGLMRLALRQTCAVSLASYSWHGVYEAITFLLYSKSKRPAYFYDYLNKALKTAITQKNGCGCLLLGRIALSMQKANIAANSFAHSFDFFYNKGQLYDATQAAFLLTKTKKSAHGITLLVRTARLSFQLKRPSNCFLAAKKLGKAGIKTAARYWLNQSGKIALLKRQTGLLQKIAAQLKIFGYNDDALFWKKKLEQK